jgi:hypothetical protein
VEPLVWTEIFGCGPIAGPVVNSYVAHHFWPLTVYGSPQDLEFVPMHPRVNRVVPTKIHEGSDAKSVEARYRRGGHAGTAHLWAGLIRSNPGRMLVHIDSDQVFVGNAADDVVAALRAGAVIAGPRRAYMYNDNDRDDVRRLPDTVATFCFGFRTESMPRWPRPLLERAIRGRRVSARPALDFFDPVTHRALDGRNRVDYLDSLDLGESAATNISSPFLSKIVQMPSGAASGCALQRRGITEPRTPYEALALKNWDIYRKVLLERSEFQSLKPEEVGIDKRIQRIDFQTWTVN